MAAALSGTQQSDTDERNQSADKRKDARFETRLKALYYVHTENEGLEKCEIINVSYGGLGIQFKQARDFNDRSAINIGVVVKWQFIPISLKGSVKWLSENLKHPIGGVELEVPLDNMTLLKLL